MPDKLTAKFRDPWHDPGVFSASLIKWFQGHCRKLPWREQPTLYHRVVSEFMLQQTQVSTVVPYFTKWIRTFPDFAKLAKADEGSVLKHWEGLGYYQRARNLHALARSWMKTVDKPTTAAQWLAYPGIGPYTAAAIASMVFDENTAVVDGNVVRILARLKADDTRYSSSAAAVRQLRPAADALIREVSRPGIYNEALMELGATRCLKHHPRCSVCPLRHYCAGRVRNPTDYPRLAMRRIRKRTIERAWIVARGRLLLQRGPAGGRRLRDIWELPEFAPLDSRLRKGPLLFQKTRGISNERILEKIYRATPRIALDAFDTGPDGLKWIELTALSGLTLSGPHRKWIDEALTILLKKS